jgi:hypothetical protein
MNETFYGVQRNLNCKSFFYKIKKCQNYTFLFTNVQNLKIPILGYDHIRVFADVCVCIY